MSIVNLAERLITLKVVYYGPAAGGKTTSLQYIHRILDPEENVELVTLATSGDKTLFFDFLPVDLGELGAFAVRVQGFTVPGQIRYSRTRRYVLSGADGVVFVANSDPSVAGENEESIRDFHENLVANGLDPATIPLVVQYNKRDLPDALPLIDLQRALALRDAPEFETAAIRGDGVFDAFRAILERIVLRVATEAKLEPEAAARQVVGRLDSLRREALASPSAGPGHRLVPMALPAELPTLADGSEDLLEHAIASGVQLSKLYAEVNIARRRLETAVGEATSLNRLSRRLLASEAPDEIWRELFRACREMIPAMSFTLVRRREGGEISPLEFEGHEEDPLVTALGQDLPRFLRHLEEAAYLSDREAPELMERLREIRPGLEGALVVPVPVRGDVEGAVLLYRNGMMPPFRMRETRFASGVANLAALALGRALRETEIVRLNRELEDRVRDRTARLSAALKTIRHLNTGLENRVQLRTSELERANETLRQTQDFLLQAEKMSSLARLAAGIAHEINNPMAWVQGNLKTLREYVGEIEGLFGRVEEALASRPAPDAVATVRSILGHPEIAAVREDLGMLVAETAQGADRVIRIAEGMRNLAYLKTSAREPVNLQDQVENALAVLGSKLTDVKIIRDYGPIPLVSGFPVLLSQLVLNVVDNAIGAMKGKGTIRILTRAENDVVRVEVQDDGPGIPKEVLPHLFEPFFTTKEVGEGTGLGLYTVYQIVERHGGMVTLQNAPEGGAVVRIDLVHLIGNALEPKPALAGTRRES